jgi:hypothetical protein
MLDNHVVSCTPAKSATNVPLTSSIAVRFDGSVTVLNTTGCMIVTLPSGARVPGVVLYDATSRTLTFTPLSPLQPDTRYGVEINNSARSLKVGQFSGGGVIGFNYEFTTVSAPSIRLFAQLKGRPDMKGVLSFVVTPSSLLTTLIAGAAQCFTPELDVSQVEGLSLRSGDFEVKLQRDRDVVHLREGDVLIVSVKGSIAQPTSASAVVQAAPAEPSSAHQPATTTAETLTSSEAARDGMCHVDTMFKRYLESLNIASVVIVTFL